MRVNEQVLTGESKTGRLQFRSRQCLKIYGNQMETDIFQLLAKFVKMFRSLRICIVRLQKVLFLV